MIKTQHRREFIKMMSLGAMSSALPRFITAGNRKPPNVLFIAVDDLRPELGCYGNRHIKTPNIDRLAEGGVTFTQAHCQSAVCNPSRASLMTGLRPDTIRVWDLKTDFRTHAPDAVTLPQYFKKNGYHSLGIGKVYHNDIPDPLSWSEQKLSLEGYPFDPDASYANEKNHAIQAGSRESFIKTGKSGYNYVWYDRFEHFYTKAESTEIGEGPDNIYYDGAQTDMAVKKLSMLKSMDKPFFFAIGYYRPHLPFNAPKKYWDLYDRDKIPMAENDFLPKNSPVMAINNMREMKTYTDMKNTRHPKDGKLSEADARRLKHGYYAAVSYVDAQIGRLLDELDRLKIADNTIVVLWGDHGWKLGEHASWCKMTNYDIDTRVPMIIRAPGQKKRGVQTDRLVEFVDIYPTLCELSGLRIPGQLEGLSTVPLMKNPKKPWKKAVFSQFLREGKWKSPDGKEYMGYSIRTERYRYTEWINWQTGELAARECYDHLTDPQENSNIANDPKNSQLIEDLAKKLKAGWKAALPR